MKDKQYKTFAFPNRLTPLETYFCYLKEFGAIPRIPAYKVVEIFRYAAEDYLDGLLSASAFSLIAFNLMTHAELETNVNQYVQGLNRLIGLCGELDEAHKEETETIKKHLSLFISDPVQFAKESL